MTESSKAAAEKARDTYRKAAAQFEDLANDGQVPEAMRALAEKNIAQTRQIYERSKDALDAVLESWERSFDAVGQGAVALNRKVIDIAQRNINSGFDLAKSLAAAKNLAEAVELQASYWRNQISALQSQAEEMRTLSTKVTSDAAEPIRAQMTRGLD
jgi:phasin